MKKIIETTLGLSAALLLGAGVPEPTRAQGTRGTVDIPILEAVLDESARARFVDHQLESHGRTFVVYKLEMKDLDDQIICAAWCDPENTYRIDPGRTGAGKWMGLQLGNLFMYSGIAEDLRFEPLPDRINRLNGTTATEFLQMAAAEQINGLLYEGGDLADVDDTLSMTYAFRAKDRAVVMAPNALHLVEGASSRDGSELEPVGFADIFTKHAFLAAVLDEDQKINMAGEMYMRIRPKAGVPPEKIFSDGKIDLEKVYDRETEVLDVDRVDIELSIKNDSGTFKPSGEGIVAFAWAFMKALHANRVAFETFGANGRSGVVEDQGHSTWEAFAAANPELARH